MITDARQIGHYTSGGTSVIEAPASFDIYAAPAVRELAIRLQGDGVNGIVFDLGGVAFMDNTALGVIVGAHNRVRGAGRRGAAVAAASEPVERMFRVTGLIKFLPMHATVAGALAAGRQW